MSALYLDSSALVKLYLPEDPGERQRVIEALDAAEGRVASSAIAYAEVASALARYFHEGRLGEGEYGRSLAVFQDDWASMNIVDVLPEISVLAGQVMKAQRGLRAMDALHLASALIIRETHTLHFLSFDDQLNAVAQALMPEATQS